MEYNIGCLKKLLSAMIFWLTKKRRAETCMYPLANQAASVVYRKTWGFEAMFFKPLYSNHVYLFVHCGLFPTSICCPKMMFVIATTSVMFTILSPLMSASESKTAPSSVPRIWFTNNTTSVIFTNPSWFKSPRTVLRFSTGRMARPA